MGGTSFEGPIRLALETLEGHFSDGELAAIIMFTDGNSPLSPETCDAVRESGVRLCLMRANPAQTSNTQQLVQLVEDTGGGDLFISNSGESGDSVTESYTSGVRTEGRLDIAQGETRRELTFGESLPPDGFGEDLHVWRIAVCIITYVLYAVLATVVYYRRITLLPQWNFYGIPPYRGPGRADAYPLSGRRSGPD
ncbi:MAG: VWA domain-containing protein [Lawsonibacter sp.]|nr:VWA domain-containing protein [Lawsonibacter sp.]